MPQCCAECEQKRIAADAAMVTYRAAVVARSAASRAEAAAYTAYRDHRATHGEDA